MKLLRIFNTRLCANFSVLLIGYKIVRLWYLPPYCAYLMQLDFDVVVHMVNILSAFSVFETVCGDHQRSGSGVKSFLQTDLLSTQKFVLCNRKKLMKKKENNYLNKTFFLEMFQNYAGFVRNYTVHVSNFRENI